MTHNYDVIIVGSGVSGLYSALCLPENARILMLSKRELTLCNSALAQGGIAGVYNSPDDNIQLHQNDTMIAGGFKNNTETVHILVKEACHDIENIIKTLHISQKSTNNLTGNGFQKLKTLYKKTNNIYVKGSTLAPFVHKLDIEKICNAQCEIYCKLCNILLGNKGCKK